MCTCAVRVAKQRLSSNSDFSLVFSFVFTQMFKYGNIEEGSASVRSASVRPKYYRLSAEKPVVLNQPYVTDLIDTDEQLTQF